MDFISNENQSTALKGGRSFACGRWGVAVAASFMIAWGGQLLLLPLVTRKRSRSLPFRSKLRNCPKTDDVSGVSLRMPMRVSRSLTAL